jgi:hypothetical protein
MRGVGAAVLGRCGGGWWQQTDSYLCSALWHAVTDVVHALGVRDMSMHGHGQPRLSG